MAGHTPGPWEYIGIYTTTTTIVAANGREVCEVSSGTLESFANARLIAAAPELLTAAKFAVEVLDEVMGNRVWDAIQSLQSAIDHVTETTD